MIQIDKLILISFLLLAASLIRVQSSQIIFSAGIIVNHQNKNDVFAIQSYINRINSLDCPNINQINVISPLKYQQAFKQMNQRRSINSIPLNFAFIVDSELTSKFIIPKESKSDLFYIGNVLSQQTCEQINKKIQKAASYMIGGIVPLIGQQGQQSVITVENTVKIQNQVFSYNRNEGYQLFQIVQNIRIISRHTIELSKSAINEVALMSKQSLPACEEILINFVASHFYPEIKNRYFPFAYKLPVDKSEKSMNEKNMCVKRFISILGYCPLYYQKKIFNVTLWRNPQEQKVVELKKVDLKGKLAQLQDNQRRILLNTPLDKQMDSQGKYISQNFIRNKPLLSILIMLIAISLIAILFLRNRLQSLKNSLSQLQKKSQSN